MFSRNRSNGQQGASGSPKGSSKEKVHQPKKRAPNPRVALVIRGKIHRLLQGSTDHHVPAPHHYHTGMEEEEVEREKARKDHRRIHQKVDPRVGAYSTNVSNEKEHRGASGPSCVGEVELNREGCIRIPCTLQHKRSNKKRISFECELPPSPEQMRRPLPYSRSGPEMNSSKFSLASGGDITSPRLRPKRPYSAGDCIDYNFNRTLPGTLLEEDEDKEEESSAIIDHILKELRGINKIQEEISDLRDYLTSVRGSVEEVSSCVDAVILEIEGIRANKRGSGEHADTWSGAGSKDESPNRRRPASAYGSLGSAKPKSDTGFSPQHCKERHSIHGDLLLSRAGESNVSPITESGEHQDLDETEDTSDHSSDIPVGTIGRKFSFGYLERPGHGCPSISSLSSDSSKSESDLERPMYSSKVKQQRFDDKEEHWSDTGPPHSSRRETEWQREKAYLRDRHLKHHEDESSLCCEGAGSWDHYSGVEDYGKMRKGSMGTPKHLSVHTNKHYNSPSSTSGREEWHSRKMTQNVPGIHIATDHNLEKNALAYECGIDFPYHQSSGYHVNERQDLDAEGYQSNDLSFSTDCQESPETNLFYSETSRVTWASDSYLCTTLDDGDKPFIQDPEFGDQTMEYWPAQHSGSDAQAGSFNVKRIGQAVYDFSSALRGALRKLDAAQNPEDEAYLEIPMPSEFSTKPHQLSRHTSLEKSDSQLKFSFDNAFEEATNNLGLESVDNSKHMYQKESASYHPMSSNDVVMSTSDRLPEELAWCLQDPVEGFVGLGGKAQVSQCTTEESLSMSLSVDELRLSEEQGENRVIIPKQLSTDTTVSLEDKAEDDGTQSSVEISQMAERRVKCTRSFQQILKEKRESRRQLTSMTISTFSQGDLDPGSQSILNFFYLTEFIISSGVVMLGLCRLSVI